MPTSTAGTPTRTQRKARATEQAIIEAARDLLTTAGAQAVTLEAVAQRADVAVQTIYNRVGGRTALLMAVAEQALAANRAYVDEPYASTGTVAQRLRRVAQAYVTFALERPHEFRLVAFPPADAPAQERLSDLVHEQNGKLAMLLAEGAADGSVRPGLDPQLTATVLWRMWDGVISLAHRTDGAGVSQDELTRLLVLAGEIMSHGILTGG